LYESARSFRVPKAPPEPPTLIVSAAESSDTNKSTGSAKKIWPKDIIFVYLHNFIVPNTLAPLTAS
jgi:hypothetical protein